MPGCHQSRVTKERPTGSDIEGNVMVGVGEVENDAEEIGPGVGAWGSAVVMIVAEEIGSLVTVSVIVAPTRLAFPAPVVDDIAHVSALEPTFPSPTGPGPTVDRMSSRAGPGS